MGWQTKTQSNLFFSLGLLSALKQWILNNGKTLLANIDKEEKEQIELKIKRHSGFPFFVNFCAYFSFPFLLFFLQAFQWTREKMVFLYFMIFQTSWHSIYVSEAPQEKNITVISKQVPILI